MERAETVQLTEEQQKDLDSYLNKPEDLANNLGDACKHMPVGKPIIVNSRTITVLQKIESQHSHFIKGKVSIESKGHAMNVEFSNGNFYFSLDGEICQFKPGADTGALAAWNKVIYETIRGIDAAKQQEKDSEVAEYNDYQNRERKLNAERMKTLMDM